MSGNKKPYVMNNTYGNYGNTNPNLSQDMPIKKERLRVQLTHEERGFFSSLFQIADKDGKGRLVGKEAAEFLKRSGLPKELLKNIWIISAQTDHQFLERDEFYIALRLVALAQNNMEFSDEIIRINHPLPPLPKFDLKSNTNSSINKSSDVLNASQSSNISPNYTNNITISESDPFYITEIDVQKYTNLFIKNKDMENKMSINKAYQMWTTGGVSMDVLKRILYVVPLADKTCLNFNEFKVIFHLIYKSLQYEVPNVLPNSLKRILSPENDKSDNKNNLFNSKEINFGDKLGIELNLGKQKEKRESVIDTNSLVTGNTMVVGGNNNMVVTSNNLFPNNTQINTNKSIDMESLLMNEFNLKNTQTNNNNLNKPYFAQNLQNDQNIMQNQSNIQAVNNLSNNVTEKFNNIYNDKINESKFLEQTIEEETNLLKNLREEVEKIYISINQVNQRNLSMRSQILEIRRQIELERDSMSKSLSELNQKSNEMYRNQDELVNLLQEKAELSSRRASAQPNQQNNGPTLKSLSNNNNNILFDNSSQLNSYNNSNATNYNQPKLGNMDLHVDNRHPSSLNQNFTNMRKISEEKSSIDLNPVSIVSNVSNANNIELDMFPESKTAKQKELPINSQNNTNAHEENPSSNTSSPFMGYPKFTNASSGIGPELTTIVEVNNESNNSTGNLNKNKMAFDSFKDNIDNETNLNNRNNNLNSNNTNQKNIANNPVNSNFDSNGFDFTGFNDFKVDSFKEFADKKGDDFFKKQGDFQGNWDEF